MAISDYQFLKPGNGHQMANKKKAMALIAKHLGGVNPTNESLDLPDWGNCQIAAYTSKDGAMIVNASDPKHYGELAWHHRDHLVMLREIPDAKSPRCIIYICKIKDLFDAPSEQWLGKAGVKWAFVGRVAKHKEIKPSAFFAALLS